MENNNSLSLMNMNDNNADMFMSFKPETTEDKVALYNALNSPDFKVSDMINKNIKIRDAVLRQVDMVDEDTGEVQSAVRSIIIDTDGKTYSATSTGVYNSLRNINAVFGTLHFDDGLKVVVQQIQTKKGSTLSLAIAK